MPVYKAPVRDFQFILHEYLNLGQYKDVPGFADSGPELMTPVLEAAAQMCEEVLFPLNQKGDKEGLQYDNGKVIMPGGFKEAYEMYVEGGWPSFTCDPAYGGQGLPDVLNMPLMEMVCSANLSFGLTPGLSHGAYNAIMLHGSDALKKKYLPRMVSGHWSGVMCLTEPQAGTDLGLIRTKAEPQPDGSYAITGGKIFISSGEHDLTENIIHLILARLPGAPSGTKGISLFLAPKFLVNDDGSLGARNKLRCDALEHKMGIHASPTCVMNYDGATGWLVGAPNKGMKAMFTMMNAARLYVGVQGLGIAEVAYQNALAYARERLQSRAITGARFPDKPADPIIVHPDVRRMLLTQRAFTEGCRALALEMALKHDLAQRHPDPAVKQECDDFVQLLTPVVKSYLTDGGFEMASLTMQVYGGYGFIKEYGVEQYVRDARITMIYEGTNGIQALDLVGRKLPAGTGRYLRSFFHPVDAFIARHKGNPAMAEFTKPLYIHMGYLQKATMWIAMQGLANPDDAAGGAVEYQKLFAHVALAYVWARQAEVALRRMPEVRGQMSDSKLTPDIQHLTSEFYESKIQTARFYMQKILPNTISLLSSITSGSKSMMQAAL
ncbi:MAG: acyl-CoA dehydrogenase C-terminal domain-containing protein [Pseudomonadota bacterium]|nr:acyl-CoA dehydrogenase C-terminal domain-containing protein [Pseudomonadota bacterium]MDE3037682.1 acyl-CoA dehydrogenase C-terminal domain-containing protein [Pseudomonadota bacterium]